MAGIESSQSDIIRRRSSANWQGFEEFLLEKDEEKPKSDGGLKSFVSKLLHHRFVEGLIVALVFTDIILLGLESGIDHHLVCIDGRVESSEHSGGGHDVVVERSDHSQDGHNANHAEISYNVLARSSSTSLISFSKSAVRLKLSRDAVHLAPSQETANVPQSFMSKKPMHQGQQDVSHPETSLISQDISLDNPSHGSANDLLVCETRDGHHAQYILHTCHTASITILVLFLVEILLKFWVDPDHFLSNAFTIIDALIVIVSLIIDTMVTWYIMSHAKSHDSAEEARGTITLVIAALIFVRLWRVVRIIHGLLGYIHEKGQENAKMEKAIHDHQVKAHALRELCAAHNIDVPEHCASSTHLGKSVH